MPNTGKEEAKDGSTPKRARAGKKKADGAVGKNNAVAGRTAIAVGMRVKFYVEDPRCSLYGSGEVTGVYGYGDGFVSVRCIVTLKKYFVKAGQCVVVSTTAAPIIPDAARDGVRVNFENQLVIGWGDDKRIWYFRGLVAGACKFDTSIVRVRCDDGRHRFVKFADCMVEPAASGGGGDADLGTAGAGASAGVSAGVSASGGDEELGSAETAAAGGGDEELSTGGGDGLDDGDENGGGDGGIQHDTGHADAFVDGPVDAFTLQQQPRGSGAAGGDAIVSDDGYLMLALFIRPIIMTHLDAWTHQQALFIRYSLLIHSLLVLFRETPSS